ncbi:MAG TPA: DNA-processing protein DprA [Burkholderiaceae bacterium]|nr:DNA-processing protein DprA [Burkholderiaceae bacterium]
MRALLAAFGLPDAILRAARPALQRVVGEQLGLALGAPAGEALRAAIDTTREWLREDPRNTVVTLADADYPAGLLQGDDPPPLIYCSGRRDLLRRPAIAVVGSRNATRQGEENAARFAQFFAGAGYVVVSGLALGIDAAAHRGALAAGPDAASTIAVLGTGVDIVYPAANRALARQVRDAGLLVSELPLRSPPRPGQFPRRNRLIAGLSRGVLVVEAALRSGSLITARLAAAAGRDVFAIPGSIHAPLARGCHRLIKDGAKLVETGHDVLSELAPAAASRPPPASGERAERDRRAAPTARQRALLDALGHDPASMDVLCERSGGDAAAVAADLLELEMAQHVERLPGNVYQRLR